MGPVDGANRGLKFSRRPGDGELFTCFFYDSPGFIVTPSSRHEEVSAVVQEAVDRGVELWQINLPLTPDGIRNPTTRRLVF